MTPQDPYQQLIEELVQAIELRECGDPDGASWGATAQVRRLEQQLVEAHRVRPGRWATGDELEARIAGRDEGLPVRTMELAGVSG